jgi:Protein of unknown function (DUF3048) N-terminal domain/Protein of unknown function (DUF3048) C-terminal domain
VAALAVLLPSALLLSGCTPDAAAPIPERTASDSWNSTWATPAATQLAALRGTSVPAGSLAHPSLAVKIDNHEAARPQFALERTDLVFEELVEGGLTRYVAVWQSDIPDLLGPIRSIRPMDPDIITPLGGIVAYSGGQEQFVGMMQATGLVNAVFDYDETGMFYRVDGREAPHDVVVKASALVGKHPELPAPVQQFAYSATPAAASAGVDGTPVTTIKSVFSDARWPSWTWDLPTAAYLRSQEGAPDLDTSGAPLKATNVVVMRVGIDWRFGEVPKTTMIGSGEAWVSAGGKTVHATWSKDAQASPIRLVDDNGVTIRLAAGNTWIELVPGDQGSVELIP